MHFVRTEDLKTGMRLARPVYNKKSILLFDRNSLLSLQAIESIRNFGLIGVYVLEPAEPLPPLTQEDLEFERFQIQAVSAIEEEQDRILKTRKQNRTQSIADMVIRNYGHLDEKINFYQNLRSREDYFSRHSLNVAILCAMITHVMNIRREEQYHTVCAAILHDMGKVKKHDDVYYGAPYTREDMLRNCETQEEAYGIIEEAFATDGSGIRRICQQAARKQLNLFPEDGEKSRYKMLAGANVLLVANRYDEITAMTLQGTAQSEVMAAQELLEHAREIGIRAGLHHVYVGNVKNGGNHTSCPACGETAVRREGFRVSVLSPKGICPRCGLRLSGIWQGHSARSNGETL